MENQAVDAVNLVQDGAYDLSILTLFLLIRMSKFFFNPICIASEIERLNDILVFKNVWVKEATYSRASRELKSWVKKIILQEKFRALKVFQNFQNPFSICKTLFPSAKIKNCFGCF